MFDQEKLPDIIRDTLDSREPKIIHDVPPNYKHAGVLIPLMKENGVHKVLFTKRTDTVEHHKGQISFPGGAKDFQDRTLEETALRESYEEIGLLGEDVEILGRIDDILTLQSSFVVRPFIGLIPSPYDFCINELEVVRLIKIPWNTLIRNNLKKNTYAVDSGARTYKTPVYEYNGDVIWGATALIMDNFIDILSQQRTLFV